MVSQPQPSVASLASSTTHGKSKGRASACEVTVLSPSRSRTRPLAPRRSTSKDQCLSQHQRREFFTHFGSPRSNVRMRWSPRALWFVHYHRGQSSRAKCIAPPAQVAFGPLVLLQIIRHPNVTSTARYERQGSTLAPG